MSCQSFLNLALAAFLLVVWAPCARGAESPESSRETLQVRYIEFHGIHALQAGELKKVMETKEKRFRWFSKAPLKEADLNEDLDRIEKYYRSRGFYHVRLVSHKIVPLTGDNVKIEIEIEEGPPMVVSSVSLLVDGETEGSWHGELMGLLPLKPGERFEIPVYQDIEKVVLRHLGDWGYPKAHVDLKATLNKNTNLASASVSVEKGEICYIGSIKVEGNETIEEEIILRELTFKTGDRFAGSKIQESQQRLFGLDLFQFVDLSVENMEGDGTTLPIRVLVRAAKKQTVRVGVGYGTEDDFRGQVQYEVRNFMGDGRRLQVNTKASSLVQFLEGKLLQPYVLGPRTSLTVSGGVYHEVQESFENRKLVMSPVLNYKWQDKLSSYVGYNLEANRLLDVNVEAVSHLPVDEENEEFLVSSFIEGTSWDNVDDLLNPKKGVRLIENLEWASVGLGSQVDFVKVTLEGRGYLPFKKYGVLAGRLELGAIHELENTSDIPIFKRFFSGGSDSVRGYPYQRLGPADEDGNPVGGLSLVEGSLEYRFPIRDPFEGVVFSDFGNVFKRSFDFAFDDLRYTAGVGVRYLTLVGPLRLDVGYQLNPPEGEFFDPYQFHFSIGQAF